jgi:uncharacterized membrane protein
MTLKEIMRRGAAYTVVMFAGTLALTLVVNMTTEELCAIWWTFTALAVLVDVVKEAATTKQKQTPSVAQYFERIDQ